MPRPGVSEHHVAAGQEHQEAVLLSYWPAGNLPKMSRISNLYKTPEGVHFERVLSNLEQKQQSRKQYPI